MARTALAHEPAATSSQTPSPDQRAQAEQLTMDLVQAGTQYGFAPGSQKSQIAANMLGAAINREQALAALLESAPGEFLRLALPSDVRASLPASVQAHVEQEVDVEGTLEILHEDDNAGGRYHYHLVTAAGRLTLRFATGGPDGLLTGFWVRAQGVQLQQTLALNGSGNVQPVTTALPNTFGAQSTLVILVNFTDLKTQPYTVSDANTVAFTTTSNFHKENSYGQTWLTGAVVGWYTIPMSSTVCDYNTLATQAIQAATSAGVKVSNYSHRVYAFPQNACGWSGLGTVGGTPSDAWINGSFQSGVLAHETGHNLGLYHSHSYDCGTVVLGGSCTASEYGDTFDTMGGTNGHYSAFQKERLGWLNYGSSPPLYTISTSGTYTIEPYETATANSKGIKLVQHTDSSTGTKTWYYIEYRQPIGFDGFVSSNSNVKNGVLLHIGTDGDANSSYLLDLTPSTSSWSDPALDVGQSYYDASTGVTITPVWADSTGTGVSVSFGSLQCARGTPTVTMSPSQSQWAAAGTSATFTISLTNNDSQGCAASTFALGSVVPSGWTGTLGSGSLTVNPGGTVSTPLTVTSPASAADGFYTVTVNTSDASTSTHTASASATYVVMSKLSVTVATDKTGYVRPATVTITTVVKGAGSAVSGATVSVTVTKPNKSTVKLTATTDATGTAVVKVSLTSKDPKGTYQVNSTATMGGATGTASKTFGVQ